MKLSKTSKWSLTFLKWMFRIILLLVFIVTAGPRIIHFIIGQPALTKNSQHNVVDADAAFKQRVKSEFPLGMNESELREKLTQDGFNLINNGAVFEQGDFVCSKKWVIGWKTENQHIYSIDARYGLTCI